MNDIVTKVITTVASTITVTILSYLTYRFRNLILYKETQYVFDVEDGTDPVAWDIQLEKQQRITIEVNDISNDRIEGVRVRLNKLGSPHEEKAIEVNSDFIPLFGGEIQIQLASIVRTTFNKEVNKPRIYTIQFILRRRRRSL
jgi:hypothetical protein